MILAFYFEERGPGLRSEETGRCPSVAPGIAESMNLWRLQNNKWVQNWDYPELLDAQEPNGPATREVTELMKQIDITMTVTQPDGSETVEKTTGVVIETPEQLAEVLGTKSWKVEIQSLSCKPDAWTSNSLRFADQDKAKAYADDLYYRWTVTKTYRIVPSSEEPNR